MDSEPFCMMTSNPILKYLVFCSAAPNEALLMDLGQKQVSPAIKVIKPAIPLGQTHDGANLILANPFIYIIPCFHRLDCG